MAILKNQQHERFAQLLAGGMPGSRAYRQAGYKSKKGINTETCASRLSRSAQVRARVAALTF